MSKREWQAHVAQFGPFGSQERTDHIRDAQSCPECRARMRSARANRNRRARADVMSSLGMTRVKGGWE